MTQLSRSEIEDDLVLALRDAQKGDQSAWKAVFEECYPKVRRVVRRRLDRSMRSLYDSTDFANDAMENLAANLDQLEFPSVSSLIGFLAHVAEKKVIDEYRRQHTLKRDVTRERPISRPVPTAARSSCRRTSRLPVNLPRPTKSTIGCCSRRRDRASDHRAKKAGILDFRHRRADRLEYSQGSAVPGRPPRFAD